MPALPAQTMTDQERREALDERSLLDKRIKRLEAMISGAARPISKRTDEILAEALEEMRCELNLLDAALDIDRSLRLADQCRRSGGRICTECGHYLLGWAECPTCVPAF